MVSLMKMPIMFMGSNCNDLHYFIDHGQCVFLNYEFDPDLLVLPEINEGHTVHIYISRCQPCLYNGSLKWFIIEAFRITGNTVYVHYPKSNFYLHKVVSDIKYEAGRYWVTVVGFPKNVVCKTIREKATAHTTYNASLHSTSRGPCRKAFDLIRKRIEWLRSHKWVDENNKRVNVTYYLHHCIWWHGDMIRYQAIGTLYENKKLYKFLYDAPEPHERSEMILL